MENSTTAPQQQQQQQRNQNNQNNSQQRSNNNNNRRRNNNNNGNRGGAQQQQQKKESSPAPSGATSIPVPASKSVQQNQQQQQQAANKNKNGNDDDEYNTTNSQNVNNNNNNNRRNNNNNNRRNNNNNNNQRRPPKKQVNTESFEPCHDFPDMRVVVDLGKDKLSTKLSVRDVLLCPNLFTQPGDETIYERLLAEMEKCTIPQERLMKLWHGDSHLIADDKTGFAKQCPTFQMIIERIKKFFNMKVNATRYNFFRDTSDHKPRHHDAAQFNEKLAGIQNITVGVSFGTTRDADFEEVESKKVVRFPLTNGSTYVFCRDLNCMWRHGIPQVHPDKQTKDGRISIIAWGWVDQVEYGKLDI